MMNMNTVIHLKRVLLHVTGAMLHSVLTNGRNKTQACLAHSERCHQSSHPSSVSLSYVQRSHD